MATKEAVKEVKDIEKTESKVEVEESKDDFMEFPALVMNIGTRTYHSPLGAIAPGEVGRITLNDWQNSSKVFELQ